MPSHISALIGRWAARVAPLAALHLAALVLLLLTEDYALAYVAGFLLAWGLLNGVWLALLGRPAVSALLSLAIVATLIEVSKYKVSIVAQTVNFMDVMVIDPATFAFLFALMPRLHIYMVAAALLLAAALALLWRFETLRVPRLAALAGAALALAGLFGLSFTHPFAYGWYGHTYVSDFARSGADAVRELASKGYMESDAVVAERLKSTADAPCKPAGKPPHIILVHDESAFDLRVAPGVKLPPGYGQHFRSFDGKQRNLVVEVVGGGSWYTEFNILAGLSTRSFGKFAYFVTRIATGRVERGLPTVLRRCGYRTYSLYPYHGAFLSARSYHTTAGVQKFFDMNDLRAAQFEPDRFYYDAALRLMQQERASGPMFLYVFLSAGHSPYTYTFRPELTPDWEGFGNAPDVDEYLRRQTLSAQDYKEFLARLAQAFPGEPFLVVRYGDHQPYLATTIIEPGLPLPDLMRRLEAYDPKYLTTYYAMDAVNFTPVDLSSAIDTIEVPYLGLLVLEGAGLPLDASFAEQKRIFQRCRGLFYRCAGGAEARRFNRMLIDAGLIKGL